MSPASGALRCTGLTAGPVLGLSLVVEPGLTVLVGEDGCGTSTLLRLLAREQAPEAGTVEGGPAALLTTPPGDEWSDHDVAVAGLEAPHLVGREMWTLSGGERQRVRLATVLASPHPALLLDEPLGLLDDRAVLTVLRVLAAQDRPCLVVCKSDPRAAAAADRVLTMSEGRLHA